MELTPVAGIVALAFLAESLTEYFFAATLVALGLDSRWLRYVAAAVGVALALAYGVDALRDLLGIAPRLPFVGEALTGLLLGRGANFVHDFYATYVGRR